MKYVEVIYRVVWAGQTVESSMYSLFVFKSVMRRDRVKKTRKRLDCGRAVWRDMMQNLQAGATCRYLKFLFVVWVVLTNHVTFGRMQANSPCGTHRLKWNPGPWRSAFIEISPNVVWTSESDCKQQLAEEDVSVQISVIHISAGFTRSSETLCGALRG